MTNEEAIDELEVIHERLSHPQDCEQGVYSFRDGDYLEALDMAIKALEQEDVLDKIRAEIEQKQYDFMDDKDYDEGIRFGLMLAYQTVDKYNTESEDNKDGKI